MTPELAPLEGFLGAGLDDFDAGDGLLEAGVHDAEGPALGANHRAEAPEVTAHGHDIDQHEEQRHQYQLPVNGSDVEHGQGHAEHDLDDEEDARVDHVGEKAHVVVGARHDVADALPVMEGLALAQQTDVELLA